MNAALKHLSSSYATIACIVMSITLLLLSSIEQANANSHVATAKYIHSFFIYWTPQSLNISIPYLPGGYLVGLVLILNIAATLTKKSEYKLSNAGLISIKVLAIVLLIAEGASSALTTVNTLTVKKGEVVSYSKSVDTVELVVVDHSLASSDRVFLIPETMLRQEQTIRHPYLPFAVSIDTFYENSKTIPKGNIVSPNAPIANQGHGESISALPIETSVHGKSQNRPTAFVTIFKDANNIGSWITHLDWAPQQFAYQQRQYSLQLRRLHRELPLKVEYLDHQNLIIVSESKPSDEPKSKQVAIDSQTYFSFNNLYFRLVSSSPERRELVFRVISDPAQSTRLYGAILICLATVVHFGTRSFQFAERMRAQ